MTWMMEQYEKEPLLEISFNDIPSLLNNAEIVSISRELTGQKAGSDIRSRLFALFEPPASQSFSGINRISPRDAFSAIFPPIGIRTNIF